MVREKENMGNFVSCRMALSVMTLSDLESQNRFRFVLLLRCIHAAYCYRRVAVAWSVRLRGVLLLGLWLNNRVANVQALPCFSSFLSFSAN